MAANNNKAALAREGAGPFRFDVNALAVGEYQVFNYRDLDGQRYRKYLPFDGVNIENDSGEPVTVQFDNRDREVRVDAGTSKEVTGVNFKSLRVENVGSNALASSGLVTLEVTREKFGDDDLARKRSQEGPFRRILRNFTGL